MSKEAYRYITGTVSAANAVGRNSRTKVFVPRIDYSGGGSLTTTEERMHEAVARSDKWDVFQKEQEMGRVLARQVYEVVHRTGSGAGNTYDATVNGIKADFKRTGSHNNILKYAKDAVRKQGAEIVVFQFDSENNQIYGRIAALSDEYGIHGLYFFTGGTGRIYSF